jgi:hypothetical protein
VQTKDPKVKGHERRWLLAAIGGLAITLALGVVVLIGLMSFLTELAGPSLDGCGSEPANPKFCLTATIQNRHAVVTGRTTLPDGAIVEVWIENYDHFEDDGPTIEATTSGGIFTATFDVSAWHPGHVAVAALLRISDQPADIVARYGADGTGFVGPATRFDYDYSPPPQDLEAWADLELRK